MLPSLLLVILLLQLFFHVGSAVGFSGSPLSPSPLSAPLGLHRALSYGGILNRPERLSANQSEAEFLLETFKTSVPEFGNQCILWDASNSFLQVLDSHKMILRYTKNHLLPTPSSAPVMGITAHLDLLWETPDALSLHHAVLTMDRRYKMHLYTHTYTQVERPRGLTHEAVSRAVKTFVESLHDSLGFRKNAPHYETNRLARDFLRTLTAPSVGSFQIPLPSPMAGSSSMRLAEGPAKFRLLSYNIWNFNKQDAGYAKRLEILVDFIRNVDADVIGLQEIRFDFTQSANVLGPNQMGQLTSMLPGYQFVFQPAMSYPVPPTGRVEEGLGILSKYPILKHDYVLLPRDVSNPRDDHQRICLHAEIEIPGFDVPVHFFVTHLALHELAQLRSVRKIWHFVKQFEGPAILMGDFNNEPPSKPLQFLAGKKSLKKEKTTFQDVWLLFHPEPRAGVDAYGEGEARDAGLTFSTDNLRKRIDIIYLRDDSRLLRPTAIFTIGGNSSVMASDHLGLVTDFESTRE